jgi:hypothetical protein
VETPQAELFLGRRIYVLATLSNATIDVILDDIEKNIIEIEIKEDSIVCYFSLHL